MANTQKYCPQSITMSVESWFQKVDADGNGLINLEEFLASGLAHTLTEEEVFLMIGCLALSSLLPSCGVSLIRLACLLRPELASTASIKNIGAKSAWKMWYATSMSHPPRFPWRR